MLRVRRICEQAHSGAIGTVHPNRPAWRFRQFQSRAVVKKILEHLGLPATEPPKAPAGGAAQLELDERPADELRDELPN